MVEVQDVRLSTNNAVTGFPVSYCRRMTSNMAFYHYKGTFNPLLKGKDKVFQKNRKKSNQSKLSLGGGEIYSKVLESKKRRFLIHQDYSQGKELFSIAVYDDTGTRCPLLPQPIGMNYSLKNDVSVGQHIRSPLNFSDQTYIVSCDCVDGCSSSCICALMTNDMDDVEARSSLKQNRGLLLLSNDFLNRKLLVCCGDLCKCPPTCKRRLENLIKPKKFEIYKYNDDVGYCLRTMNNITYGELVIEFVGKIKVNPDHVSEDYAMLISKYDDTDLMKTLMETTYEYIDEDAWRSYQFEEIHLDPYDFGNASRFLKHACIPNTYPIRVIVNDFRPFMHRFVFVATAPIPAGAELTFDYGRDYCNRLEMHCKCNAIFCVQQKERYTKMSPTAVSGVINAYTESLITAAIEMDHIREQFLKEQSDARKRRNGNLVKDILVEVVQDEEAEVEA
ncbi:unnamed protein product [Auanema sp. JU1783]|nr:unnamed protein product [Auanema sp. JU1783]